MSKIKSKQDETENRKKVEKINKMIKLQQNFVKKPNTQITNGMNERKAITTDPADIRTAIRECYEQFYT